MGACENFKPLPWPPCPGGPNVNCIYYCPSSTPTFSAKALVCLTRQEEDSRGEKMGACENFKPLPWPPCPGGPNVNCIDCCPSSAPTFSAKALISLTHVPTFKAPASPQSAPQPVLYPGMPAQYQWVGTHENPCLGMYVPPNGPQQQVVQVPPHQPEQFFAEQETQDDDAYDVSELLRRGVHSLHKGLGTMRRFL